MSDTTALVLSLDEAYTERAIASVRRQTLPPAEIVVVRGVSPFHRAFNSGLSRIRTEFFIQVDADMILDPTCIADLRGCMSGKVGIVLGQLRDPLLGRIVGVKLFRRECFDRVKLRDSLSSETDSAGDIWKEGWTTAYAAKHAGNQRTFGEHRPDYNPDYTFSKFMRDGAKARYRKAGDGLRSMFRGLLTSGHEAATIATIAAAHGIFLQERQDLHGPPARNGESEFLEAFLKHAGETEQTPDAAEKLALRNLGKGFKRSYQLGGELRRRCAPASFIGHMRRLQQGYGISSWVALVGLCHGLFAFDYDEAEADKAFGLLKDLLPVASRWRIF
jgi:hypothetical protein